MDLTVIVISTWVLSTCLHEFAHAFVAYLGGDKSVKDKGYLTLNPIAYFSSATTLVIPVLILLIGGIPFPGAAVSINTARLKSRLWQSCVSLAGPLATFFTLVFLSILFLSLPEWRRAIDSAYAYRLLTRALGTLIFLHTYMLMLNLIPIPPLDGFGVIEPWLPAAARRKAREYSNAGFAILIALFWLPTPLPVVLATVAGIVCILLGVDYTADVIAGLDTIKDNALPLLGVILLGWVLRSRMAPLDEKADKLLREKKFEEALALYDQALAKKEDARILAASATCLAGLGRKEEALGRATRACAIDPDSSQALGIRAACLIELGRIAPALEAAEVALKADHSDLYAFPLLIKASALMESRRYEEALAALDAFTAREANNADGVFMKASCLEHLGRYEQALSTYDRAARMSGSSARAILGKGLLLCSLGRTEEGLREFNQVLPASPDRRDGELQNLRSLLNESAEMLDKEGETARARSLRDTISQLN